ncbi:nitroreductase family protein [Vallitalea sp.]|uniref:nitroreductase family protein n=1 Tax=Vallitalea sp. TaxID=1882829 RepID=UPI0025FCC7E7|nr:nitroreductase family protein [Vallitalea sp.]MCT4685788.1 nitroreductase family protein [Vallitalea sp.]
MNNLNFIYNRHSVRKFTNQEIPMEDIMKILEASTYCPSAKNAQNWHFVVVKNTQKIEEIAKSIENKNSEIADKLHDESKKASFTKFIRFATLFRNAPAVILVYASSYTPNGLDELQEAGGYEQEINHIISMSPQMQSIGALIENLTLASAAMGYGTCWMTSGNYAAREISEVVQFNNNDFSLAAIVPIGVPNLPIKSPSRKSIEEVISIIE